MEKGEKPERLQKSFLKLSGENQRNAVDFAKKLWRQEQGADKPLGKTPLAKMPISGKKGENNGKQEVFWDVGAGADIGDGVGRVQQQFNNQ
jgi:hypothetical protein